MRTNRTGRQAPIALLSAPANMTSGASGGSSLGDRGTQTQANRELPAARATQPVFTPATDPAVASALPGARHAPFLAHLVATRLRLPQTRERRRASVSEALTCYRTVAALLAPTIADRR